MINFEHASGFTSGKEVVVSKSSLVKKQFCLEKVCGIINDSDYKEDSADVILQNLSEFANPKLSFCVNCNYTGDIVRQYGVYEDVWSPETKLRRDIIFGAHIVNDRAGTLVNLLNKLLRSCNLNDHRGQSENKSKLQVALKEFKKSTKNLSEKLEQFS
jgi:hypothetical protein